MARVVVAASAAGLAACSVSGSEDTQLGSLGAAPATSAGPAAPAVPEHVAMGGFLEGPVGTRLGDADRAAAFKAESQAVSSGERRTWRGAKGVYGYVVPGPPGAPPAPTAATDTDAGSDAPPAECRTFTHTVYFGGRPQVGHGTGCRGADGTWRIVS